ncbi:MAG: hypothetical protein HC859_05605 [Bacteroidia bacterium]|nr:hypothetical protein [Bacteroidia bacterium]
MSLGACTQRTICPAYQSAFIYDKEALRKKFSYFEEDSIPKVLTASKNQFLIAEPTTYRKKVRSLQTVVMKDVNPVVPDSIALGDDFVSQADLDSAARSVIDSTFIVDVPRPGQDSVAQNPEDSVYVITKDKEVRLLIFKPDSLMYRVEERRFNTDQDNYMWYLRDYLVLPDVRLAQLQGSGSDEGGSATGKKEKKGIKGFFKNLFKKKKKTERDTTEAPVQEVAPEDEEFEFVQQRDSTQAAQPKPEPEKKKGLFSFLKKDKSKAPKPPKEPKKKKEKKKKREGSQGRRA